MSTLISNLATFGPAGLIGLLWLLDRMLTRRRETQLTAALQRILRDEQRLRTLADAIARNTAAITRFTANQNQQSRILRHLLEELHHGRLTPGH